MSDVGEFTEEKAEELKEGVDDLMGHMGEDGVQFAGLFNELLIFLDRAADKAPKKEG